MEIRARGEIIEVQPKQGARGAPKVLWLKIAIPMDKLTDEGIAKLARWQNGGTVGLMVDLGPFVEAGTGRSGRQATIEDVAPAAPAARRPERPRPLPEETCASCGYVIGEDADRRFYTPIAGGPRPMHGRCADAAETTTTAAAMAHGMGLTPDVPRATDPATEAAAGEDAGSLEPAEVGEVEVIGGAEPAPGTMQPTAGERPPAVQEAVDLGIIEVVPARTPSHAEGGWAYTTDPPRTTAGAIDPEAAAALADDPTANSHDAAANLPPHLARIDAASDAAFEGLGPSPATRRKSRHQERQDKVNAEATAAAAASAGVALSGEAS